MNNLGYARVSTQKQDMGMNTGLNNQSDMILDFVEQHNLNLSDIIIEIASSYYNEQTKINQLLQYNNITIIITDISRLSRNISQFKEYAKMMIKNNIRLISIQENINGYLNNTALFHKVLNRVEHFQNQISDMINNIQYKVDNNWDFRQNKFGRDIIYENNIRKVINNTHETHIINLIKSLKKETKTSIINKYLSIIIPNNEYPIELKDKYGNVTDDLGENKLDYNNIANILNSYQIYNRGKKWNICSINNILKN